MTALKKGDVIGIISPSAPIAAFCPKRLERGVNFLKKEGFDILVGDSVSVVDGFTAGTAEERARDINAMFANKDVRAIVATIGGYNANDVLPLLDYDLISANNDKIIVGYSDITVLIHALYKKANVKGVMGPMILPQFAEYPTILPFTLESFNLVTQNLGTDTVYEIPISHESTEEMLLWDSEDTRARKMQKNLGWHTIASGVAEGILMPANLNTLCKLIGTPYLPDMDNAILFLEDDADEGAGTIQRMLQHLKQAGQLQNIKGLVFGRFQEKSEMTSDAVSAIIKNVFSEPEFPVVSNVDFGHTDPMISLPIGNQVTIDTHKKNIRIIL